MVGKSFGQSSATALPVKRIPKTASITFHFYANENLYFHTMELDKEFSFRCYCLDADGFEAVMTFKGTKISFRTTSFHPDYIDGSVTMSSRKATKLSNALMQMDDRFVDTSTRWD